MRFFVIELIFPFADTLATLAIACQIASFFLALFLVWEWSTGVIRSNVVIRFLAKHAVLLMLIVAFAASMGSLFFSEVAGWAPCKLCWFQRIFMYPQVILLGVALRRNDFSVFPSVLLLCLIGMSISVVHYSEQVLAMFDPVAFDPLAPCDSSGISCATDYIQAYGYITIPMLALTAFISNALIAVTALRHPLVRKNGHAGWKRLRRAAAGIAMGSFLAFAGFAVFNKPEVFHEARVPPPSSQYSALHREPPTLALTPKDQLETTMAQAGIHWTHAPAVPLPITRKEQRKIVVKWEATERIGDLDPETGVRYEFWGVEGSVPGPILRVRQGDLVELHLTNNIESEHPHNIDFHFSTGPGGGASALSVQPGETAVVHLRALQPGFFMYHCATPDIPTHIANGMYGGVIVDPADAPLPATDNEFAIVQSEFYTESDAPGLQPLSLDRLDAEDPAYVVFNGAVGALTGENSPHVNVGDRIRLYILNAGPQLISSFHVIGEIFDRVYREGDLLSPPSRGIQTTLIPAGGASVVDFTIDVPGTYILVDHAIARAIHKGAIGTIVAEGENNYEVFQSFATKDVPDGHGQSAEQHDEEPVAADTGPLAENEVLVRILKNSMIRDDNPENDYSPGTLTVKAGTTVTWINEDRVVHTVTARDGSFDSAGMRKSQRWSRTFTEPGVYEYYCTPHPWMIGRIIVEN